MPKQSTAATPTHDFFRVSIHADEIERVSALLNPLISSDDFSFICFMLDHKFAAVQRGDSRQFVLYCQSDVSDVTNAAFITEITDLLESNKVKCSNVSNEGRYISRYISGCSDNPGSPQYSSRLAKLYELVRVAINNIDAAKDFFSAKKIIDDFTKKYASAKVHPLHIEVAFIKEIGPAISALAGKEIDFFRCIKGNPIESLFTSIEIDSARQVHERSALATGPVIRRVKTTPKEEGGAASGAGSSLPEAAASGKVRRISSSGTEAASGREEIVGKASSYREPALSISTSSKAQAGFFPNGTEDVANASSPAKAASSPEAVDREMDVPTCCFAFRF